MLTVLLTADAALVFAQGNGPGQEPTFQRQLTPEEIARQKRAGEEAAHACAVCGGGMAAIFGVIVVIMVLNIALLIWVARDAKSRGMDSSVLWMFLVMFTSVIGLVIYLFSRPQGELMRCATCRGNRLKVSAVCPHCHHP
jgi:phospholipase D-like protein